MVLGVNGKKLKKVHQFAFRKSFGFTGDLSFHKPALFWRAIFSIKKRIPSIFATLQNVTKYVKSKYEIKKINLNLGLLILISLNFRHQRFGQTH